MSVGKTMLPYVVRQGDYLAKLAFVHGFDAGEVWNDPKNEDLRKLRPDPNILAPGDILFMPEKEEGEGIPVEKGAENAYGAEVPKVEVCVVFKEIDGKPMANEPYEIEGLAGPEPDSKEKGTTDAQGKLKLSIPVTTREFSVYVPGRHLKFRHRVGEMDPIGEATGIRKRLQHLGFGDERLVANTDDSESLREAIATFQEAQGLKPTGALDDETNDSLVKAHGV